MWLVDEMGYIQSQNDTCVYYHPDTKHTVVVWVDDLICRGSQQVSDEFYSKLAQKFDCKEPQYVTEDNSITFTGWDISMRAVAGDQVFSLSQQRELEMFLEEYELSEVQERQSPMPDKRKLVDSTVITENEQKWCRAVIGGLNHFVRPTRYDIAHAVSRVSADMKEPTLGTVSAIRQIAGYLKGTTGLSLTGKKATGLDTYEVYVDSDHFGDRHRSSKSHSGLLVFLNGVLVAWRSKKQKSKNTALSPVESEIYALSEGTKEARNVAWVLQEMGSRFEMPMEVMCDSDGAVKFAKDAYYDTKIKGVFDKREEWVKELRGSDLNIKVIASKQNWSDMMTKCLKAPEYKRQMKGIMEKSKVNFGRHLYE